MVKFGLVAAALLLWLHPTPARTQTLFQTGNDIYNKCNTEKSDSLYYQQNSYCLAYIVGSTDTLELFRAFAKKSPCVPSASTQGQLRDIVLKYLRDNPAKRSLSGSIVTVLALTEAFECK